MLPVKKTHLSRTVRSRATNTGDTGDGATGSPRLGRGLLAGVRGDGVGLALVLGHRLVDLLDDIQPDRGRQDGGEGERPGGLSLLGKDRDGGAAGKDREEG